ncbi:MAG TPA: sugar phosphate isomerase/epimerase, partial [Verrucomicrobiae bacterium]
MSMELQIFKTLWGHAGGLDHAISACSNGEWDGLEGQAPATATARTELAMKLAANGLSFIAEICTAGSYVPNRQASAAEHLESLRRQAENAVECNPLFLTIIAGCDAWPVAQSVDFFGHAMAELDQQGAIGSFETHRSRSFF